MATLQANTVYVPESAAVIRDDMLTDIRLESIAQGVASPAVQPGTDNWIWCTAVANAGMLQYANVANAVDDSHPGTATGESLELWRKDLGLPEAKASASSGKLRLTVSGSATVPAGAEFVLPNGLRGAVVGTWPGVVDNDEIDVTTVDTGSQTQAGPNTIVRFVSPPLNVSTEAHVSVHQPLTGGKDAETSARKRVRVQNRLAYVPSGGNWAHVREVALNALTSVQDCYVYPALGGPGSAKVVPVKAFDPNFGDYSRAFTAGAIATIRSAIQRELPTWAEVPVVAVWNEDVDVSIGVTIPDSAMAGGDGTGWMDTTPWPDLYPADAGRTTIDDVTSSTVVRTDAQTPVSPIAGQTHIAWWNSADRRFEIRLVVAVSGSAGAWVLTLDSPILHDDGTNPTVGEHICPAAVNTVEYGKAWVQMMQELGPGENTTDVNRIPRSKRRPFTAEESPSDITIVQLTDMRNRFDEITDAAWEYRSATTPTVPGAVSTAPNVLRPQHFAVHKQVS